MLNRRLLLIAAGILVSGSILGARGESLAIADGFVLVRNAKNATDSVSHVQIKDMAVGKKKVWGPGAPVQLVLGPVGSGQLIWFASLLGVSESTLMSKIKQEVFKGEMRKPITAATDQECLNAVMANVGAFGIVSAGAAHALPPDVAVLLVQ